MFKRIGFILIMLCFIFSSIAYAKSGQTGYGSVLDVNNGKEGQILVNTGDDNGNSDIGKWVNSDFLKGEKGDNGRDGIDGINGIDGQDGYTPIKNVDYFDGKDGLNGVDGKDGLNGNDGQDGSDGEKGEQGVQGEIGLTGSTGEKGNTGDTGSQGQEGKKGEQGKQGIQGERGKGLEDRVELIGEVRLLDTKRTTWSVYAGHDFNNDVNIVGGKVTIKFGRSYEERRIDELEATINNMTSSQNTTETIVKNSNGEVVSIHLSNNDRAVNFSSSF